jgi:phage tail sheath protein FI
MRPDEFARTDPDSDSFLERGPGFTLDDLVWDAKFADVYHSGSAFGQNNQVAYAQTPPACPEGPGGDPGSVQLGSYAAGTSCNAVSSSYSQILSMGYDRFTVPLFGGFDGLDIKEAEPFNNARALGGEETAAPNERDNAMYYTVKKAIDTIADVEVIDTNLLALPGVTVRGLTAHALTVAEDRADTLAVIDLEAGYTSSYENTDSFATRGGSVAGTVSAVKNRAFNNSYGACYYPWVRIVDSLSGQQIWMPPSVVALGTYASSARRSELWFAPAGFNRGGLSRGAAGFPVVGVVEKLTSKERDSLYEVNVNPIASFPSEGIVVFGQKTLQATPSALDRVNVRRLLCYLKKQISRIANNILFDPNTQVTWDRFLARVNPLLRSVKSRFGLQEYRVVLDTSTTTPELIDRNIMYAKVFLKPTRAIEFIALDFIITRTGASFDD